MFGNQSLERRIAKLEAEMTAIQTYVAQVESDYAGIKTDLTAVQTSVTSLSGQITALQSAQASLSPTDAAALAQAQTDADTLKASMDALVAGLPTPPAPPAS